MTNLEFLNNMTVESTPVNRMVPHECVIQEEGGAWWNEEELLYYCRYARRNDDHMKSSMNL